MTTSPKLSLYDVAAGTVTNLEMHSIEYDLRRLAERIGKLLKEGHGQACECITCRAIAPKTRADYFADLAMINWAIAKRTFFTAVHLLSDNEAKVRWEEREAEIDAEVKAEGNVNGNATPEKASPPPSRRKSKRKSVTS